MSTTTTPIVMRSGTHDRYAAGKPPLAAAGVLIIALILAFCVQVLQEPFREWNATAVLLTGGLFAVLLAAAPGIYVLRRGRRAEPKMAGLLFLTALSLVLLATYFFWVRPYVFFPADFLIWSEGGFVNSILKFSTGYPQYTPAANLDSEHYVLGPPLLTGLLAWMVNKGGSIPVYRLIQVGYTATAAFFATLCCRRILRLARPESKVGDSWIWNAFWYAVLLLAATNSITNRFAHNLHGDALAQLAAMATYYLLLVYIETRSPRVLAAMVLLVPIDFLIKQNLLIWAVFFALYLAVWDRSSKRAAVFSIAASAVFGVTVGLCYVLWGSAFVFWIFTELSQHAVSPLRGFQHVLDSWAYFAAGLLGGVAVLRGSKRTGLYGAWLLWLAFIGVEAWTSGIEWMLNHLGSGCLMAGVWFVAGLTSLSSDSTQAARAADSWDWIRVASVTAAIALLFNGLGMVRIPLRPISADAYRYVRDIEKQFEGQPAHRILLDAGTWIYAKNRVIMGDRAPAVGMLGMTRTADFSGIRSRIEAKHYSKILVRNLHEPNFWYENALWPKPSGLRKTMLDNYRETGRIPAAQGPKDVKNWAEDPYLFDEITILEPK